MEFLMPRPDPLYSSTFGENTQTTLNTQQSLNQVLVFTYKHTDIPPIIYIQMSHLLDSYTYFWSTFTSTASYFSS